VIARDAGPLRACGRKRPTGPGSWPIADTSRTARRGPTGAPYPGAAPDGPTSISGASTATRYRGRSSRQAWAPGAPRAGGRPDVEPHGVALGLVVCSTSDSVRAQLGALVAPRPPGVAPAIGYARSLVEAPAADVAPARQAGPAARPVVRVDSRARGLRRRRQAGRLAK
jgi:hypothetical protein